jgi:glycosyltransferase involved in cell wall biosynthesis
VTVNSKAVLSDVIKRDRVRPDKLVLIYNGINSLPFEVASRRRDKLREEMGLTGSDKVIIVVANLIPYKGHSDFLKAARLVFDHIPTALFWLVGDDRGIRNDLEHVASIFGIHERVRFMGQRYDIDSLLAVSNLAVLPSHEEGFSNVILESMAAGLPVVATSVGGNPEAVVDGVTGWIVPPRNPAVMAEKIVDLLGDPQRAISWGELGRRRVKELFSVERMVESHVRLYEERGAS